MNIELNLIVSSLNEKNRDSEILSFYNIYYKNFSKQNKQILDFIRDHYLVYKEFPSKEILKSKFFILNLDFNLDKSFDYYKEIFKSQIIKQEIYNRYNDISKKLETDSFDGVKEELFNLLKFLNVNSKSFNYKGVKENVNSFLDSYRKRKDLGFVSGFNTGMDKLDYATSGILPEQLWLFLSRPGMYKTMLICWMAVNIAKQTNDKKLKWTDSDRIVIVSSEMSREEIEERLFAIIAQIPLNDLQRYIVAESTLEYIKENVDNLLKNIYIIDEANSVTDIYKYLFEIRPVVGFIDGVYLFGKSRDHIDQSAIIDQIKSFTNTGILKGIPLICTSQLNQERNVGFSDSYFQNANVFVKFYRLPNKIGKKEEDVVLSDNMKFIVKKVRRGKDNFTYDMYFDKNKSSFFAGSLPYEEDLGDFNDKDIENYISIKNDSNLDTDLFEPIF